MNNLKIFPVDIFWWDYSGPINFKMNQDNPFQSSNDILKLPEHQEVKNFISECLDEVKIFYSLKCEQLEITTSWINSYSPEEGLNFHTHPLSSFSGVLFLSDGDPIIFKDPIFSRSNNSTIPLSSLENCYFSLEAIKNRLIIFPWWLEHGVSGVSDYRYSLSFNSMPVGKVNYDDDLNLSSSEIFYK